MIRIFLTQIFIFVLWQLLFYPAPSFCSNKPTIKLAQPQVFVISLDGFRGDYIQRYAHLLGNLSKIAEHVQAEYVISAFPSLTFPNHYSIATGCYTETHGIVHNSFFDPKTGHQFKKSLNETYWNAVEPIWITAEKQNIKTAVYMWPGGVVPHKGWLPSHHPKSYDERISWTDRVDHMMELFASGGIRLGMMYYHEPDKTAHHFGPESREIEATLHTLNYGLGHLLKAVEKANLSDKLDLIILSDHGLASISKHKLIVLSEMLGNYTMDDFFDTKLLDIYSHFKIDPMVYASVVHLWPRPGLELALYLQLKSQRNHNLYVYLKDEIPQIWHYRNNPRIAPVIAVARAGWQVVLYRDVFDRSFLHTMDGMHGYDTRHPDMRASFFAMGPSFRKNVVLAPFENVNYYSLFTHLAGIMPEPNNGTIKPFLPSLNLVAQPLRVMTESKNSRSSNAPCYQLHVLLLAIAFPHSFLI